MSRRLPPGALVRELHPALAPSAALALARAGALAHERLERIFRRHRCEVRYYAVLEILTNGKDRPTDDGWPGPSPLRIGMPQSSLRRAVGVSPAVLSRLVRDMEGAGIVQLSLTWGGRENFVRITDRGFEIRDACRAALRDAEEEVFAGIDSDAREALRATCLRLPTFEGRDRREEWWLRRG
ncbi:MAG: MarR family winged helix-turn-helix transcriptional regulator [Thermoleophilaceae bacterium]